jgi:tRNA threonylcarbamoyladenosine biosynthesis protein TsaE
MGARAVKTAAFEFVANDEGDTDRFGAALAQVLPAGAVVALVGTLGAGKTRLVQAVAKAVGIDPSAVLSPTFVLVHEYTVRGQRAEGRGQNRHDSPLSVARPAISAIYHIDAYRIRDDDEFRELGPEEYFESDGWTFIEWADRVADCLPREYLAIGINVTAPSRRRFVVNSHGRTFAAVAMALPSKLGTYSSST